MNWNKRTEEDTKSRQTVAAPAASSPSRPTSTVTAPLPASVSTLAASAPPLRPEPTRPAAILGRNVIVRGQISSKEDLTIDGDVEGSIDLADHRLTIGPNGKVTVDSVKAREVVVMGSLKGRVDALDKVFIKKDAQLVGDVQTAGIVIEDGAYFKGGIDIRKPPTKAAT